MYKHFYYWSNLKQCFLFWFYELNIFKNLICVLKKTFKQINYFKFKTNLI